MKKKKTVFKFRYFRWLILVDTLMVVLGVMSFGAVTFMGLDLNTENAIMMLGMIPPMALSVGLTTWITVQYIRHRLSELLDGIQSVADGDLDVRLDEKKANEYREVFIGFNRMVMELKRTKAQMQQLMDEFTHEFKTPITSVKGFSEYLIETGQDIETPERMQYLHVIADEAARLSDLSYHMLLLSKVEACEIITDKERFDLSEQLRQCMLLLLPYCEKKGISLNADVDGLSYYGNPELLQQVWINIMNNAVKFTPENGEINVSAYKDNNGIVVKISDNGIGMDEETIGHIFQKNYQGENAKNRGGNGIGLSIVHRIVELCEGEIEVSSRENEGSTFKITLPVPSIP